MLVKAAPKGWNEGGELKVRSGQIPVLFVGKKTYERRRERVYCPPSLLLRCQSIKEQVNRSSRNKKKEMLMMRVGLAGFD
jgi:hypothetical protein